MAEQYRVAIIGSTGRGNYGHGLDTVWHEIPQTEVVAVADDNAQGLAAAIKKTGAAKGYADYAQMLKQEKPDIVAVGPRWIDRHHEMVLACTEVGAHIYMEKPFCRTMAEADEMVKAVEATHVKLAIAHQSRYSPVLTAIQKMIAEDKLGTLLAIRARGKEDRRGGAEDLWVLGTHVLDLMRALAGDARSCNARMTNKGQPVTKADVYPGGEGLGPLAGDGLSATYVFDNNVNGYFSSYRNQAGNPRRFGLQIFGSKGIAELFTGHLVPGYYLADSSWSPGRSGAQWVPITSNGPGKPESLDGGNLHSGNIAAVKDLIAAIEEDRLPLGNIYNAAGATEMIHAVFESHRQKGPVEFPLKNREHALTMLD
jgi:predicted dehydrogenase